MTASNFDRMRTVFGEDLFRIITEIGKTARTSGYRAALVGGAVRDLLAGKSSDDIDFLIEGPAIQFAKALSAEWSRIFPGAPAPLKNAAFAKYGTVKLSFESPIAPGVDTLDFASARSETYPVPGGAPVVEFSDIGSDLARRDFSINAMAIMLDVDKQADLIDEHGGAQDLKEKLLTVLHDRSFVDDPARIIRGIRFASRFGFSFGQHTGKLATEAVRKRLLDTLPRRRLLDEFRKALQERDAGAVAEALHRFGVLTQIHPQIELRPELLSLLNRPVSWEFKFRSLFSSLDDSEFQNVLDAFEVGKKDGQRFFGSGG